MFSAVEAERIIGVAGLQYDGGTDVAILHTDGVHPCMQNRGIGTALVFARFAALGDDFGCKHVGLLATEHSRGFFQRFGFVMRGDPEFDSAQGFEVVGMEMEFSSAVRAGAMRWLRDSGVRIEESTYWE